MIAMLLATVAGISHNIDIEHGGKRIGATYAARAVIDQRTIGAHTPNRADGRQCRWTATILVDRSLGDTADFKRTLSTDRRFSGSTAGPCTTRTDRAERQLARQGDMVRETVLQAVERDRSALLAELDALRTLAAS